MSFCCGHNAGNLDNTNNPLTNATKSVFIGYNTKGINNSDKQVVLGSNAVGHGTNTTTLGDSNVTSLYCNVTSITNVSDERDKDNIIVLDNDEDTIGLDIVNTLNPINFIWNPRDNNANKGIESIGFTAQELLQSCSNSKLCKYLQHIVDNSDEEYLKINQTDLIPLLVKAVNELTVKTEKLEKKLYEKHGIKIE